MLNNDLKRWNVKLTYDTEHIKAVTPSKIRSAAEKTFSASNSSVLYYHATQQL